MQTLTYNEYNLGSKYLKYSVKNYKNYRDYYVISNELLEYFKNLSYGINKHDAK